MKDLDVDKMQSIIQQMPQYNEILSKYALHMHLIDQSFAMFNKLGLKEVGNLEQTVVTGVDATGGLPSSIEIFNSVVALMSGPKLAPQDKLRMAILLVSSVNLNEQNYSKLRNLLADPGDLKIFDNMLFLNLRNNTTLGASKSKLSDDDKKYFKAYMKTITYDLVRYVPKLQTVIDQMFNSKLNLKEYNSVSYPGASNPKNMLSNDLLAYKTNNLSKGVSLAEKNKLVVFSIGGLSHSEIRIVKEVGKRPVISREHGRAQGLPGHVRRHHSDESR
jgi:syntaxin-binding protein 1